MSVVQTCDNYGWRPDVVFQVGLGHNHGEVETIQALWKPSPRFIAVEPHPDVCEASKETYPGEIIQAAVSWAFGEGTLYMKPKHADGSSLFPLTPKGGPARKIGVPTLHLDRFVDKINEGERVLLWLDCEGSELAALWTGGDFLDHVDVIDVEMTGVPPNPDWPSPLEIHEALKREGFAQTWVHTIRGAAGQYNATYVRKEMLKPEFCCVPEEILRCQS